MESVRWDAPVRRTTEQLRALMDLDNDFHPAVPVMGGSTCGDIVGGHLASLTDTSTAS